MATRPPVKSEDDGLSRVYHDSSLKGLGTKKIPLSVVGEGGGSVDSVTGWLVDNSDPANPVIDQAAFTDLSDTPASYTGSGGYSVSVKLGEDGLEFTAPPGSSLPGEIGVSAATTAALPANTYNNGVSGVGATLTANANGVLPAQDGVTLLVNDTLLVWKEGGGTSIKNGKYTVTDLGSVSTPWILTRSTDSDSSSELNDQIVVPAEGTLYGGHVFGQTTADPIAGTDNIVYVDYGQQSIGGLFVTQAPSGTQALGQIPLWTNVARRVSKGSSSFTYQPSTGMVLNGTTAAGITLNPFGSSAGNTSEVRFKELSGNGSNYLGFKAPDNIGSNLIYILPTTAPTTGQVLQATTPSSNTSTLSWTTVATGESTGGKLFLNLNFY